jgi:hypothetical protein
MRSPGRYRGLLVVAVVLWLTPAGCGGDAHSPVGSSVPGTSRAADGRAARAPSMSTPATTAIPAKANRHAPLAERVFRVDPKPTTRTQQAVVEALEGYFDGLVKGFATNDVGRSGVRRWTTPAMYADARRLVVEQVRKGYVLYGSYIFTIQLRGASSRRPWPRSASTRAGPAGTTPTPTQPVGGMTRRMSAWPTT